jgi:hypothetical protein
MPIFNLDQKYQDHKFEFLQIHLSFHNAVISAKTNKIQVHSIWKWHLSLEIEATMMINGIKIQILPLVNFGCIKFNYFIMTAS